MTPNSSTGDAQRGILLVQWGEFEEAEAAFRRAIQQNPDDAKLLRSLIV